MTTQAGTATTAEHRHDQDQYLTFMLGRETFALGILDIKEILEYAEPTEVPMMPAFIRFIMYATVILRSVSTMIIEPP